MVNLPYCFQSVRSILPTACAAIGLLAGGISAQAALYTWTGAVDNNWDNADNWDLDAVPPSGAEVMINGPYSIRKDGALTIFTSSSAASGSVVNAFTLTGGATFDNRIEGSTASGSFRVGSTTTVTNNVLVDTGSTLLVQRFWLGNNPTGASTSNKVTTATIKGTVNAVQDFVGYRPQGASATEGGYILHIDGGEFTAPVFNFRNSGDMDNTNLTAHVLISGGGILDMGTVNANWTSSSVHYIDFIDGTGSITFGKSSTWLTQTGVEALISSKYIRTGLEGGQFNIMDNGTSWTVTVVPEPSTYALMLGGVVLAGAAVRRHRMSRR